MKYALRCSAGHGFEGWFSGSADYDRQKAAGLLECPVCGSSEVEKAVMAPAVRTSRRAVRNEAMEAIRREWNETAARAQAYVRKNFEHVGKNFPEEARKIHYGEVAPRQIYGEATSQEIRELKDEGVSIAPVPAPVPEPADIKKKMN